MSAISTVRFGSSTPKHPPAPLGLKVIDKTGKGSLFSDDTGEIRQGIEAGTIVTITPKEVAAEYDPEATANLNVTGLTDQAGNPQTADKFEATLLDIPTPKQIDERERTGPVYPPAPKAMDSIEKASPQSRKPHLGLIVAAALSVFGAVGVAVHKLSSFRRPPDQRFETERNGTIALPFSYSHSLTNNSVDSSPQPVVDATPSEPLALTPIPAPPVRQVLHTDGGINIFNVNSTSSEPDVHTSPDAELAVSTPDAGTRRPASRPRRRTPGIITTVPFDSPARDTSFVVPSGWHLTTQCEPGGVTIAPNRTPHSR